MATVVASAAWLRVVPPNDPVAGFLAGAVIGLGSVLATTGVIQVTWRR